MLLNIIYFIGGLLIGIGIMFAYCTHLGKKLLKRMHEAPNYAQKEMFDALDDVVDNVVNKNEES